MSKGQTLRALVNERLAAAAEEIFVLIERTIAEYEEELCRSKEEKRKELPDKVLYPKIVLVRGNVQIPSTSPGPGLNQEITQTPRIKEEPEEQSVKQEEEQLPEPVPESSAVCVKTEESSLLQQRQTEHREETQREYISSEPHFHFEGHNEHSSDTDNDDDWQLPVPVPGSSAVCVKDEVSSLLQQRQTEHREETQREDISSEPHISAAAQMETEADGDHDNRVQSRDRRAKLFPQNKSALETTVPSGHMSGADVDERKKHQCPFCNKRFGKNRDLQTHIRLHTGERPFSCSFCKKTFNQKSGLDVHTRTHTGEKPYSCPVCNQHFADSSTLRKHKTIHTGERPYRCEVCEKSFARKRTLESHKNVHLRQTLQLHSGFCQKSKLHLHKRTPDGERPYSCTICEKTFARTDNAHENP